MLVLEARVGRNEEADPRALVSDMRRYADVWYADVCRRMLTYAGMLTYAVVF